MKYLGAMRGSGTLVSADEALGAASYEIDGYQMKPGEVVASGELRMAARDLARAFGLRHLQLRTDDGRASRVPLDERAPPARGPRSSLQGFGDDVAPSRTDAGRRQW